jgi:hypothetical protein
MNVYHYTKLTRLNGIFSAGCIATEKNASQNTNLNFTDYVWLSEKHTYPKTALPNASMFPETSLVAHLNQKNISVDLDKIGKVLGKFYRFSFDSSDPRLTKWFHSSERKTLINNPAWLKMEAIANKVGDDVRSFWIGTENLDLENFSLDVFQNGIWKPVLQNISFSDLSTSSEEIINELKISSISKCKEFNLPVNLFKGENKLKKWFHALAA